MKIVTASFFVGLFVIGFSVLAQKKEPATPNELDNLYTPASNSVFDSKSENSQSGGLGSASDITLAFKFNPGLLFRKIAALHTQFWASESVALEGGLGVCYKQDRIAGFFSDSELNFSTGQTSSLPLSDIATNGKFNGPNLFTSFSSRFYGNNNYNNNANYYFELGTRYYANSLKFSKDTFPNNNYGAYEKISGTPTMKLRHWVFLMNYGVQFITEGKLKTSHEFYLGFGIRKTSYNIFEQKDVSTGANNGNPTYEHTITDNRESASIPIILLGYVIGLGY